MVEQQYYTRERRGLYRPSEGYDSIAKSKGLSDNFIKKYLHPFCFYDPPKSLDSVDSKDQYKYPEAFTCFQIETGEMVLGRSIYIGADFTGLRSTFFTHNFVIPADEKEAYITNIERAIYAAGFVSGYNIENGTDIPELQSIKWDKPGIANGAAMLQNMGITREVFLKLLYAAFMAASGKKKIYITLGVQTSEISKYAKDLLKIIMGGLPYDIRKNIGYITYSREPESRKYINITFIEDEALKSWYSRIEREYIFDIAGGRVINCDNDIESHPYLKFVYDNINNSDNMEAFHCFAASILSGMKQNDKLSLKTYDELYVLYNIEDGLSSLYESYREEALDSIIKYINAADEIVKRRLNRIYCKAMLIEQENISSRHGYVPSVDIIKNTVCYYRLNEKDTNSKILYLIQSAVYKGRDIDGYVDSIFSLTSGSANMCSMLVSMILKNELVRPIYNEYISSRFANIKNIDGLFDEINYWSGIAWEAVIDSFFMKLTSQKVTDILINTQSKILTGKRIDTFFKELTASCRNTGFESWCKRYTEGILKQIHEDVFLSVELDNISFDEIIAINLDDRRDEPKYKVLKYVKELAIDGTVDSYDIFKSENGIRVKELIQQIYRERIECANYAAIVSGFIITPVLYRIKYDFNGMLKYISSKGSDEVYKFILWSFENDVFQNPEDIQAYGDSIKYYFMHYDKGAFKNKEIKELLFSTKNKGLLKLLKNIELELKNPLERFIIKHKKQISICALIVILSGGVTFGTIKIIDYYMAKNSQEQTAVEEIKKPKLNAMKAVLVNGLKERIDNISTKNTLDKCLYSIKCDIKKSDNEQDSVSAEISNNEDASAPLDASGAITGEEVYNGCKYDFTVVVNKKPKIKIKDKDFEEIKTELKNTVTERIKTFIDNEIQAKPATS